METGAQAYSDSATAQAIANSLRAKKSHQIDSDIILKFLYMSQWEHPLYVTEKDEYSTPNETWIFQGIVTADSGRYALVVSLG